MTSDPKYIEQTMHAVKRLWQAIRAIKQQRGQEPELEHVQTIVTEPQADRMLLVLECLAVLAEEVARQGREVQELRERAP